jgi:hypothetical protein
VSVLRENPLNISNFDSRITKEVEDKVKELYARVEEGDNARQEWVGKQEKLIRQRKGIRRTKVFPWPGANNHSWPVTDGTIRRWKPGIVALVMQADPVCYFFPQNQKAMAAQPTAQAYYHWRFHDIPGVEETALELVDYIGQHGMAFTRQGWEYKTERQCRIVRVETLFPNGVQATVDAYNQQAAQIGAQVQAAIQAGQAPPEAAQQVPPQMSPAEFVAKTLEDEYVVKSDNPMEAGQILEATQAILQGAQVVRLYYSLIRADRPGWQVFNPLDVILPPRCPTGEIADASYIGLIHRLSSDDVLRMARDGWFDPTAAQKVADGLKNKSANSGEMQSGIGARTGAWRSAVENALDAADGITAATEDEPTVDVFLEMYAKLDLDGDGILEKHHLWYHPSTHTVLALHPYANPFFEWPLTLFQFEHTSNRLYSARGIAELLSTFQAQVNKIHNARLDAIQIVLAPMFQMRATAGTIPPNIKFTPGAIIPVQSVGDIQPLQMDVSGLIQSLNEENYVRGMAEQYVGLFDPSVMAENAPERRTATEVNAVQSVTQSVYGQDAALFQSAMSKVHRQLWLLELEFGPQELVFRVTGEEMPKLAKKSEISYDYDLVPSGTPANTSKQLAMARAREALQIFWPDQTGTINKNALAKYYFDVLDRNMSRLMVRTPEQAALIQQMMQVVAQGGQQPQSM